MIFRHHPDGWIYLDGFQATLAEFVAQRPGYSLPAGRIGRYYDDREKPQGGTHVTFTRIDEFAEPFPWPEGDEYLANAAAIRQAILDAREAARLAAEQAAADAEAARRAALTDQQRCDEDLRLIPVPAKLMAAMLKAIVHLRLGTAPDPWVVDVLQKWNQRLNNVIAGRTPSGNE